MIKLPKGFKRFGVFAYGKVSRAGAAVVEVLIYDLIGETFWGDGMTAKSFRQLLASVGTDTDLRVRFNCPGGSVYDGISMYHALREHQGNVECIVDGVAASMASVIMLAGDTRVVKQGAQVMIHNIHTIIAGDAEALRHEADVIEQLSQGVAEIYAEHTGIEVKKLRGMMDAETWMGAQDAVDLGFADRVDTSSQVLAADESAEQPAEEASTPEGLLAGWNFTSFAQHAPTCSPQASAIPARTAAGTRTSAEALALLQERKAAAAASDVHQEITMTPEEKAAADKKAADERTALAKQEREAALKADAERRAGIATAFEPFGEVHAKLQKKCEDDQSCTVETAREALLKDIGKSATPTVGHVEAGTDSREKFVKAASIVLAARANIEVPKDGSHRNEFSAFSLREMARHALELNGQRGKVMGDVMHMVGMAFHSTSDFPAILEATVIKSTLRGYSEYMERFTEFTVKGNLSDFRAAKRGGMGEFSTLDKMPEGAEYKYGKFGDRGATVQLATYGKAFSLTRQAIVNDDLNAFTEVPRKMGRAARRTVANLVWAVLTGNPLLSDGVALFHTSHGNILPNSADNDLTAANLSKAMALMAVQKEDTGQDPLNIRAKFLLVPVALETKAKTILESQYDPDEPGSLAPNPVRNAVTVISDARLDAVSTTAWYLVADPAQYDTIEVSYLNGDETPFTDRVEVWNIDGSAFKVRIDAGVDPLDYKTMVYSDGTNATA